VFKIISVEPDSVMGDEQLGSKEKFWFFHQGERWLFKEGRANTGEDWAEKVASELSGLLRIRAAMVELAQFGDRTGCASRMFVEDGEDLMHGNEILAGMIIGYDQAKRLHQSDHTLQNILDAAQAFSQSVWAKPEDDVLEVLASYLVLDALICNTDRHHENWGFLVRFRDHTVTPAWPFEVGVRVAPSFDHASSLGRELLDEKRFLILEQKGIERYARGGHGGIYLKPSDSRGVSPLSLVEYGMQAYPAIFRPALLTLAASSKTELLSVVDKVSSDRISETARSFVKELLSYTHEVLVGLVS
jgi:hypothetical protein